VRPKFAIYNPKRDGEHPRQFHMGRSPSPREILTTGGSNQKIAIIFFDAQDRKIRQLQKRNTFLNRFKVLNKYRMTPGRL